jgi:hypothetical protein
LQFVEIFHLLLCPPGDEQSREHLPECRIIETPSQTHQSRHRIAFFLLLTIRVPRSQVWFSWNPRRKSDAVDKLFRGEMLPNNTALVRCGYDSNPWHNSTMEKERLRCFELTPESYPHVWQGDYQRVTVGAYFAQCLSKAREEGRIVANLTLDPLMQIKTAWDLGFSDNTAIWIYQTKRLRSRELLPQKAVLN